MYYISMQGFSLHVSTTVYTLYNARMNLENTHKLILYEEFNYYIDAIL